MRYNIKANNKKSEGQGSPFEKGGNMSIEIVHDTGYGLIPKSIMRNKDISIQAKAIYSYLASFAGTTGKAFPSVNLMLGELGISKDTFYKYRNELEELGVITIVKERTEGQFTKNVYHLHNTRKPPCPKSSDTVNSDTVSSDTINNNLINNSIKSNSIILSDDENKFIKVLEAIPKYPLDRHRDLEMYKTMEKRYPELDLVQAIEDWRLYKLDKPLKDNSNARSQINTSFKNYVRWGKCLKEDGNGANNVQAGKPKEDKIDWAERAGVIRL